MNNLILCAILILIVSSCSGPVSEQKDTAEEQTEEKVAKPEITVDQVGKWHDNRPYIENTIEIYHSNGEFKMLRSHKDGSKSEKILSRTTVNDMLKFEYPNDHGDYFLIKSDGSLGIYDADGFIAKAEVVNE